MEKTKINYLFSIILLCMLCVAAFVTVPVHGETKDYRSGVGVGFYGEYNYPEESSEPEVSKPNEDHSNKEEQYSGEADTGKSFPKTGEKKAAGFALLGGSFIAMAWLLYAYKRKQQKKIH
ncbi:TPA: LPXTG cell wall anchor domain-containing protein [Enterococcus faecium]